MGLQIDSAAVARGVSRLFLRNQIMVQPEVSLRNNRRADLMGINAKGEVIVVEIKVSRADLLGDQKWPEYLDYCDRFFWAVPAGFDYSPIEGEAFLPERTGLIVDPTPRAVADAVDRLCSDPDLAAELGRNGRVRAAELTWAAADQELRTAVAEVLA